MTSEGPTERSGVSPVDDQSEPPNWWIYRGTGKVISPEEREQRWPAAPPWRRFSGAPDLPVPEPDIAETHRRLGRVGQVPTTDHHILDQVNAAIALAKPLLVTGPPGSGKSCLAYAIARELGLGRVLRWTITSRTTVKSGLYDYDTFGRAHSVSMRESGEIGNFVQLGPLGTAFLPHKFPRVLLIEEVDNGDFDIPTDLSFLFEDGEFTIAELARMRNVEPQVTIHTADPGSTALVSDGVVRCHAFPIIVVTHNGESDLPKTFLRRCVSVTVPEPDLERLSDLAVAHFPDQDRDGSTAEIATLISHSPESGSLSADHVLNAMHLIHSGARNGGTHERFGELLSAIDQKFHEVL